MDYEKLFSFAKNLCTYQCKARGGGEVFSGICQLLNSIAFPTLGNLTKSLATRVGTFDFLCERMGPSQNHVSWSVRLAALEFSKLALFLR